MSKPSTAVSLIAFVVVCSATVARADPIRVTSGVVEAGFGPLGQPLNGERLQLTAGGFTIGSSLEDVGASLQLAVVPTIAPGALVDFSGALHVNDAIGGNQDGSFLLVAAPFTMFFAASPARIACSSADSLTTCTGVAPFTFDATLTVTAPDGAVTARRLIGGGTVEGSLFRVGSSEMAAVRYTFDPSPVPEPSTLSLLAAGSLVAAWRRRRGGDNLR
jgi:hypothetical protein